MSILLQSFGLGGRPYGYFPKILSWILLYFSMAAKMGTLWALLGRHLQQLEVVLSSVSSRTQSKYSMPLVYFCFSSSESRRPNTMRPFFSLAKVLSRLSCATFQPKKYLRYASRVSRNRVRKQTNVTYRWLLGHNIMFHICFTSFPIFSNCMSQCPCHTHPGDSESVCSPETCSKSPIHVAHQADLGHTSSGTCRRPPLRPPKGSRFCSPSQPNTRTYELRQVHHQQSRCVSPVSLQRWWKIWKVSENIENIHKYIYIYINK